MNASWVKYSDRAPRGTSLYWATTPILGMGGGSTRGFWDGDRAPGIFAKASLAGDESVEHPFEENVWVRAALKAISDGVGQLPLHFYTGDPGSRDSVHMDSGPLVELFDSPHPLFTASEFWQAHSINYKLDGECYWFLTDRNGMPLKPNGVGEIPIPEVITPVRGRLVEHKVADNGLPYLYRYHQKQGNGGGYSVDFPPESVIPYCDYDPASGLRGFGDVQSAEREIQAYHQVYRYMDATMRSGGDPGAWIVFDQRLSAEELERRQALADDEYSVENRGRTKVLDRGAKIVPNPVAPRDLEYSKYIEWLRDSILSSMGVPPPMVGVYDQATYNNIRTAEKIMWTGPNGILSLVRRFEDVIRNKFLSRLIGVGSREVWPHFETSGVDALVEDRTEAVRAAAEVAGRGIGISFAKAAEHVGLALEHEIGDADAQEGIKPSDRAFVAANLRPLSAVVSNLTDEDRAATPMESLNGPQVTALHEIVLSVVNGDIDQETAAHLIIAAFPLDMERAKALLSAVQIKEKPDPEPVVPQAPGIPDDSDDEPEDEERSAEWDAAIGESQGDVREQMAMRLAGPIQSYLSEYETAQMNRIRAVSASSSARELSESDYKRLMLDDQEWRDYLATILGAELTRVYEDTIELLIEEELGPEARIPQERIRRFISGHIAALAATVSLTTQKRVRGALGRALGSADTDQLLGDEIARAFPQIQQELEQAFQNIDRRGELIARNEVARAQNYLLAQEARAAGAKKIRWVSSKDERVRDSHQAPVDGEVVEFGQQFSNGLRWPHDHEGSPEEVINCRCTFEIVEWGVPTDEIDLLESLEGRSAEEARAEYKGTKIDLRPSGGMAAEARMYKKWKEEGHAGGTSVAAKRAGQLAARTELSPSTVRRMHSFFSRHEPDKKAKGFRQGEDGYPSPGRVAWAAWGGDAGQSWARKKVAQLDGIDEK